MPHATGYSQFVHTLHLIPTGLTFMFIFQLLPSGAERAMRTIYVHTLLDRSWTQALGAGTGTGPGPGPGRAEPAVNFGWRLRLG